MCFFHCFHENVHHFYWIDENGFFCTLKRMQNMCSFCASEWVCVCSRIENCIKQKESRKFWCHRHKVFWLHTNNDNYHGFHQINAIYSLFPYSVPLLPFSTRFYLVNLSIKRMGQTHSVRSGKEKKVSVCVEKGREKETGSIDSTHRHATGVLTEEKSHWN